MSLLLMLTNSKLELEENWEAVPMAHILRRQLENRSSSNPKL